MIDSGFIYFRQIGSGMPSSFPLLFAVIQLDDGGVLCWLPVAGVAKKLETRQILMARKQANGADLLKEHLQKILIRVTGM